MKNLVSIAKKSKIPEEGLSVVELLIGVAILGTVVAAIASIANIAMRQQLQMNFTFQAAQVKADIHSYLNDDRSWAQIINAPGNQGGAGSAMDCLRNSTECTSTGAPGGAPLANRPVSQIFNAQGQLIYDLTAPTAGFNAQGVMCNGFVQPPAAGNDACPLRFAVTWSAVCTGSCVNPQVTISIRAIYNPLARTIMFNPSNYSVINFVRGASSPTCDWVFGGGALSETCGFVGMGTTTPNRELQILSASTNYTGISLQNTAVGSQNFQLLVGTPVSPLGGGFTIYDATAGAHRIVISPTGAVGIGTMAPTRSLEVNGEALYKVGLSVNNGAYNPSPAANNVVGAHLSREGYLSANRDGSMAGQFGRQQDGLVLGIYRAGVLEGGISVAGNTVSYGAFTGSHYARSRDLLSRGQLVEYAGAPYYPSGTSDSEPTYEVRLSSTANSSRVLGSMLSLLEPQDDHSNRNPYLIMAAGNGEIWLVDNGHDVEPGDYLISSAAPGHAEKDIGRFDVAHVIARAAEGIDWARVSTDGNRLKRKKISVTFEFFDRVHRIEKSSEMKALENEIKELKIQIQELKRTVGGV